ncbi:diaminopimelate decarboxylase [candidate division KSB1 bacterium]
MSTHLKYIDDELHWGRVKISDVVNTVNTPLYIYNYNIIKSKFKNVERAFRDKHHLICYALKANTNLHILKLIADWDYGTEVVSYGELYLALMAGFKPDTIVFSGAGKTAEEIEYAVRNNILLFNVENWNEIKTINSIAGKYRRVQSISLRINPDIDPDTHPSIATGIRGAKFGIEWKKLPDVFMRAKKLSNVKIKGIHIHLGSQITTKEPFIKCAEHIQSCVETAESFGINIKYINIGGGLGVNYENDLPLAEKLRNKNVITPGEWINIFLSNSHVKDKTVIVEPGRYVLAEGGMLITKVLYKKKSFGKTFYIVDAGMNDFSRPLLYDAYHNIAPLKKKTGRKTPADVVGPLCETGDYFAKDRPLPSLRNSDLLAVLTAGAYGSSLSSNYNSRLRLPEIIIKNDTIAQLKYRETLHDLTKNQPVNLEWFKITGKKTLQSKPSHTISFSKYSATGNDFIILDNREAILTALPIKKMFSHMCQRKLSIGADGIIVINKDEKYYNVSFYNADGSLAESCGNGLRAAGVYIADKIQSTAGSMQIETIDGKHEFLINNGLPTIGINVNRESFKEQTLTIENRIIKGYIINSGVPHYVIIKDDFDNSEFTVLARKIRYSSYFKPDGTNVNIMKKTARNTIMVRTYERGVEDETLSCGTGATACYYTGKKIMNLKSPVSVITKGGELQIFEKRGKIYLSGSVREIYKGTYELSDIL